MGNVVRIDAFLDRAFGRYAEAKRRFDANPTFDNIEACRKAYHEYVMIGLSWDAKRLMEQARTALMEKRS